MGLKVYPFVGLGVIDQIIVGVEPYGYSSFIKYSKSQRNGRKKGESCIPSPDFDSSSSNPQAANPAPWTTHSSYKERNK